VVLEFFISLLNGDLFVVDGSAINRLNGPVVAIVISEVSIVSPYLLEESDIAKGDVLHFFEQQECYGLGARRCRQRAFIGIVALSDALDIVK
jgi:hypothetical protein